MRKKMHKSEFIQAMSFLEPGLALYIVLVIADNAISAVGFNILPAFITRNLFNAAVNMQEDLLYRALLLGGVVIVLGGLIQPVVRYFLMYVVKTSVKNTKLKVLQKLQNLSIRYFETHHSGELISKATKDVERIEELYSNQINYFIFNLIIGIVAGVSIFILSWEIGVCIVIIGLASTYVNSLFTKSVRNLNNLIQSLWSSLTSRLSDLLVGFHSVKLLNLGHIMAERYAEKNAEYVSSVIKLAKKNALINFINNFFGKLRFQGIIIFGAFLVMLKRVDLGSIVAITLLQGSALYLFQHIGELIVGIQGPLSGVGRSMEILNEEEELEQQDFMPCESEDIVIAMDRVSFSYTGYRNVLEDISMTVRKGQKVAIVGSSGSGKSTVLKLLCALYPLDSGCISIGRKSANKYILSELREMVTYIPQEAYMFNTTIMENIRYGKMDATDEEVIEAAKASNAHEFIMSFPDQYNTKIYERGVSISGGQKQRIAIARAILKDSPILIMDEATSSLDYESEQLVQHLLGQLLKNKTVVSVTHRISTISNVDTIYVIEDGKIVQQGSHKELMQTDGVYKHLYELQLNEQTS